MDTLLIFRHNFSFLSLATTFLISISMLTPRVVWGQSIQFTNTTRSAGIQFMHFKGNNGVSINPEEFGLGVCAADFDGWQDIYFVNARDLYDRGIKVQNAL